MSILKLDEKGRLTLPKELRESHDIGGKVLIIDAGDHLKMIPLPPNPSKRNREKPKPTHNPHVCWANVDYAISGPRQARGKLLRRKKKNLATIWKGKMSRVKLK